MGSIINNLLVSQLLNILQFVSNISFIYLKKLKKYLRFAISNQQMLHQGMTPCLHQLMICNSLFTLRNDM